MIDFEGKMKYNIYRLAIANHSKNTSRYRRKELTMNLREAQDGKEYIISRIETDDEELNAFLFSLGCYSGEAITVVRHLKGGYGVKNVELANALGFSKPSVHNMLKSLAGLGIVKQEIFGLAFFTDEGRVLAQKYAVCYAKLEKEMTEICGNGAASENAVCGLLADMPYDRLNDLYNSKNNEKR